MATVALSHFQRRHRELSGLKTRTRSFLSQIHGLHYDYAEWLDRRRQSFLDTVKGVQFAVPALVPQNVATIRDFRSVATMAKRLLLAGRRFSGYVLLEEFLAFWTEFCALKGRLDLFLQELDEYTRSVTRLRDPAVRDSVARMYEDLNCRFSETFRFSDLHNDRDNLYTYRLMVSDAGFIGLVGYLPFLLKLSARICHKITLIHLEQE